ncbi:MAG: LpxI family protein [bacterium]
MNLNNNPNKEKVGLIAGYGELPHLAAQALTEKGFNVICCALTDSAYKILKDEYETYKYSPVEILKALDLAKKLEVKKILFIGKVLKLDFFRNLHKLDLKLLSRLKDFNDFSDDSIQLKLAKYLEQEHGLEILDQTKYLRSLFPAAEVFTKRSPTEDEWKEINYGLKIAKSIAAEDIGQTAVVSNRSIYAIEAIEGTDKCIQRAKKLKTFWDKNKDIFVCKVAKPNQDQRFDVPTIGLGTVKSIQKNGFIAFEANETFFVNQKETIAYANQNNIGIVSVKF